MDLGELGSPKADNEEVSLPLFKEGDCWVESTVPLLRPPILGFDGGGKKRDPVGLGLELLGGGASRGTGGRVLFSLDVSSAFLPLESFPPPIEPRSIDLFRSCCGSVSFFGSGEANPLEKSEEKVAQFSVDCIAVGVVLGEEMSQAGREALDMGEGFGCMRAGEDVETTGWRAEGGGREARSKLVAEAILSGEGESRAGILYIM